MRRLLKIFTLSACLLTLLNACDQNEFEVFEDYYAAFDVSASSPSAINCMGNLKGEYVVHLASVLPKENIEVEFSLKTGDGLTEGLDFEILSPSTYTKGRGTLKFLPGVYDRSIAVRWIGREIDPNKDNTLTIRLESINSEEIRLGMPGPDEKGREITIRKFKL